MDEQPTQQQLAIRVPVHVEVCLHPQCTQTEEVISGSVQNLLNHVNLFQNGDLDFSRDPLLASAVRFLRIVDLGLSSAEPSKNRKLTRWQVQPQIHIFQLCEEGPAEETTGDEDDTVSCHQFVLPCVEFDELWESLFFDTDVKQHLLEYVSTAMLFSEMKVRQTIITCNRVVLLHGPPGTGKTSLCKALAQKLAIRLSRRYPNAILLEINAHSLFSKWFSESGKLVAKLFQHIQELIEEEDSLVFVLIDEVESLTAARAAAMAGSEPSDAIRVVNALLTQLDALKTKKNVLILTTSNVTEAIDLAFVDRADIKQYIGLPSPPGRFEIVRSCLAELMRVGIIYPRDDDALSIDFSVASSQFSHNANNSSDFASLTKEQLLLEIVRLSEGFSGRALRKMPIQAHAAHLQAPSAPLIDFLRALAAAIAQETRNRAEMEIG